MDYTTFGKRDAIMAIGMAVIFIGLLMVSFYIDGKSNLVSDNVEASIHQPEITEGKTATANTGKIRWGYYVAYDRSSYESIKTNMKNLDYVSPYWYHMDG